MEVSSTLTKRSARGCFRILALVLVQKYRFMYSVSRLSIVDVIVRKSSPAVEVRRNHFAWRGGIRFGS